MAVCRVAQWLCAQASAMAVGWHLPMSGAFSSQLRSIGSGLLDEQHQTLPRKPTAQ